MTKFWYFLSAFAESGLSVFGVRGAYEQPAYQVVQLLSPRLEIRRYEARMAVQTEMRPGEESAAFGRLFRYITGANVAHRLISMTTPVVEAPAMIAMTMPVLSSGAERTMQFLLPAAVVSAGVPSPTDPMVHVVPVPAMTLGVIRFTGIVSQKLRDQETALLREGLARAGKTANGTPIYLSYDPPFTIPFLRRNEVALPCS